MSIKNFSFEQIQEKADEIRKMLDWWKPVYWASEETESRNFLMKHEFAPLVATICDEQINADDAWHFPCWLSAKMNEAGKEFVLKSLLDKDLRAELNEYLEHKWPKRMDDASKQKYLDKVSAAIKNALRHFTKLGCTPVTLFGNRIHTALEIYFTLRRIPGIGVKKANMITRDFVNSSKGKEDPNGWFTQVKRRNPAFAVEEERLLDMPIDVHVVKVFNRLFGRIRGNWWKELPYHTLDIVAFSKLVTPEFPAGLDELLWNAGRNYCYDYNPQCVSCPLNRTCEVGKKS